MGVMSAIREALQIKANLPVFVIMERAAHYCLEINCNEGVSRDGSPLLYFLLAKPEAISAGPSGLGMPKKPSMLLAVTLDYQSMLIAGGGDSVVG